MTVLLEALKLKRVKNFPQLSEGIEIYAGLPLAPIKKTAQNENSLIAIVLFLLALTSFLIILYVKTASQKSS